ncbi:MAG: molybdopterin-binding protein [Marmoricola sp.]|nr:molybdopterin-binding protein [Marmoricola sp.]
MKRPPIPTEASFTSRLRDERLTARIGTWLGIAFGLCFVTGLISHWYYLNDAPFFPPVRPVWGYRITQGVHVLSGIAAIPLLLVKLWSVYPKLFGEVPFGSLRPLLVNLAEKASIAALVAASIFQLATGLANYTQWYPWSFSFRSTHYAVAWIAIGALVLHIAVKLPIIRGAYAAPLPEPEDEPQDEDASATPRRGPSRRTILRTTLLASGVAVLAAAGNTVPLLRKVSVFAVRTGEGPQGVPVNRSAKAAGVLTTAVDPAFRLTLANGDREVTLTRDDLESMTQRVHQLPIACVEGWSAGAEWTGVRFSELLDLVEAPEDADLRIKSLQTRGSFGVTQIPAPFARDALTLLALKLNGEDLTIDHGFPCRLIAPNRPGVFQTKWVTRIEVVT